MSRSLSGVALVPAGALLTIPHWPANTGLESNELWVGHTTGTLPSNHTALHNEQTCLLDDKTVGPSKGE